MLYTISPSAVPAGYGEALVSLTAAKAWLRVETEDDDALIEALRDAAVDLVEKYCNLFLAPRTGMTATFAGFGAEMRIGYDPASTIVVTAIDYADGSGAAASIADEAWRVGLSGQLLPAINAVWPLASGPVTVTFSIGYAAGQCPAGLISAVKMMTAFLYANREAAVNDGLAGDIPRGVAMICDRYRIPVI